MCTLVGRTVGVLHRELAATVTDTEECALELGVTLLGFPDVHLTNPPDLTVPSAERIDAVGLGTLCIASLIGVTDTGPQTRQVEVQTVVVFCPTRTLEGDELRVGSGLHFQSFVDRMC